MQTFQDDINKSVEILRKGGVILYPCDTIWGLGCDATNAQAVKKVFEIKKREESKSLIVLVSSFNDVYSYVEKVPSMAETLFEYAESPLTIIYPKGINIAKNVLGEDESIAIRVTKETFSQSLIRAFKKPLVSTSANISGEKTSITFYEIEEYIFKNVDYVVDFGRNNKKKSPSKIIKINEKNQFEIIRK